MINFCLIPGVPAITMASDTPVVEGERLRLHCSVKGYPTPLVVWSIGECSFVTVFHFSKKKAI